MTLPDLSGTSADRYNETGFTVIGHYLLCIDHFARRDRWYVNMKQVEHVWIDPYDNIWVSWRELGAQNPMGWETSKRPDWIPSGTLDPEWMRTSDGPLPQIPDYTAPDYWGVAQLPNDQDLTENLNQIFDSGDPGPPTTTIRVIQVNANDPLKLNDLSNQGPGHLTHYEHEIHWPPTGPRETGGGPGGPLESPGRFTWIRAGNTRPPGVPGHDSYEMDFQTVRARVQRDPTPVAMNVVMALQHLVRLLTCAGCDTVVTPKR